VTTLSARAGYALWAPRYAAETAVSALENEVVRALPLPRACRSLLDVGCGTGRRLALAECSMVVGVDLSPAMLAHATRGGPHALASADAAALPFSDAAFDRVWCRLVIGHVREIEPVYAELARVCTAGGYVVVTDFHAEAAAAGHRRTFRDDAGDLRELEHHVHALVEHVESAARAGFELVAHRDGRVGPSIRHFYGDAGRLAAYDEQLGLPLVLALAFRRAS
jgi:malonyl-CoA O-methyltransferase